MSKSQFEVGPLSSVVNSRMLRPQSLPCRHLLSCLTLQVIGSGGGVAGQDLSPATGQVEFADGESLKQLQLTVVDDQVGNYYLTFPTLIFDNDSFCIH